MSHVTDLSVQFCTTIAASRPLRRTKAVTDSGTASVKPAKTGSNGATAAGVRSTPYGHHGRPVWMLGATAYFYDGDAARWRSLPAGGTATSVSGLTTDSPLIPDAFGVPRVSGHVAPGPLNAAPAGTGVILR